MFSFDDYWNWKSITYLLYDVVILFVCFSQLEGRRQCHALFKTQSRGSFWARKKAIASPIQPLPRSSPYKTAVVAVSLVEALTPAQQQGFLCWQWLRP